MAIDQYFTPDAIAARMVAHFRSKEETFVADFAAGNGDLLQAARRQWPKCGVIATDIDESRVRMLRRSQPSWLVGKCDFLNRRSRDRSPLLKEARRRVSLVLLNPPFSCRGNERFSVDMDGERILCSRALAFVLNSLPFLSPKGRLAAVLPAGCLTSQKDSEAWEHVRRAFDVRVISSHGLRAFDGCAARTVVVCLRRLHSHNTVETRRLQKRNRGITVRLIRGVVPVHVAVNGMAGPGWPFVHTTHLRESAVTEIGESVAVLRRFTTGPSVLIPRVGQPDSEKCALYLRRKRMVLSDCVFAIQCSSPGDARAVHRVLHDSWEDVRQSYGGTCAPYTTREGLVGVLERLGFDVLIDPDRGKGSRTSLSRCLLSLVGRGPVA